MKTSRLPLLLAGFLSLSSLLQAQTTAVPGSISYQGRVVNANGDPVGAGTPVNRTVVFRVWDHPSNTLAGNLIYSEQQTVTISEGEFSVLVGQGVATAGAQFGYSETARKLTDLGSAFAGTSRYLGVTVDDGTATADNEVTPRQQIVTTAFAFRSKVAETLGNSTGAALSVLDNGNVGVNNPAPAARFTVTGVNSGTGGTPQFVITDSVDQTKRLRIGVDSTGTGTGFIQSFKEGTGVQNLLLNPGGGNVGIGKVPSAGIALDVNGAITASGAISAASFSGNGSNLTNLNAANLTGTVLDARLSANVPLKNAANAFAGQNTFAGNVGIGTTSPGFPLNFPNGVGDKISLWGNSGAHYGFGIQNSLLQIHSDVVGSAIAFGYGSSASFTETMRIQGNGNVGIGMSAPTDAKLVVNGGIDKNGLSGAYVDAFVVGNRVTHGVHPISIKTSGTIWAGVTVIATSDERIKNIQGRSNAEEDLRNLLAIEITDFRYKDVISKGDSPQKKVIAQQVEKVFPQAVQQHTDVVPDIYKQAEVKKGWVQLSTDLKKGERVRLIGKAKEGIHEVLEVEKDRFRTEFESDSGKVFVFGREVNDFRSVDYEAISMLNVSATQQIKKEQDEEIKALKDENASLRDRLSDLEAKEKTREARLAAIEKSLLAGTQPVVLKTSARR